MANLKKTSINFRCSKETKQILETVANLNNLPVSKVIEFALDHYINHLNGGVEDDSNKESTTETGDSTEI